VVATLKIATSKRNKNNKNKSIWRVQDVRKY